MKIILAIALAALAVPALAQEGRYVDPQPVNFDAPFLFDGIKARELPASKAEPIPIEQWLANGRTTKGLIQPIPPREVDVYDEDALKQLFKDLLPSETGKPRPPASER